MYIASFPGSPRILQATESWAGPGNKARLYIHSYIKTYLGCSNKIQTCHMTQVLLKLRFTAMERLSGYILYGFLHLHAQVYY